MATAVGLTAVEYMPGVFRPNFGPSSHSVPTSAGRRNDWKLARGWILAEGNHNF